MKTLAAETIEPARSHKRVRLEIQSSQMRIQNGKDALNMRVYSTIRNSQSFRLTKREAELRKLPLSARRIAQRFGLDSSTARLITSLAALGDGDRHE